MSRRQFETAEPIDTGINPTDGNAPQGQGSGRARLLPSRQTGSIPAQFVNLPLVGPVLGFLDESQSNWIPAYVFVLFFISLCASDACIPVIGLPTVFRISMPLVELRLPIGHPTVIRNVRLRRSGEEVQVIWKNHIPSHPPCRCFSPDPLKIM